MNGAADGGGRSEAASREAGEGAPSGPGAPVLPRTIGRLAPLVARVALGAGFLSAVADRLGYWGPPGAEGVAWGSFARFLSSVETLNPWFPEAWIPAVGVGVTVAEGVLGLGLLAGWRTRALGAAAGLLLLAFGAGMTAGTGLKSALDASVFAAAAAGLLLLRTGGGPLSVDRATAGPARAVGRFERGGACFGAGLLLVFLTASGFADRGRSRAAAPTGTVLPACAAVVDTVFEARTPPPRFYEIELVPTGNVTGTGSYFGKAEVRLQDSPFDVAVSEDGTFRRHVRVDMTGLRAAPKGDYVVWATTPDLDTITKLGALGEDMTLTADVAFPKFLLVVTLEENPDEVRGRWTGPIVHRGMSRSGFMHTMAGHGPFQSEPCSSYGFRP